MQFLVEHLTFLGFEGENWMLIVAGLIAVHVLFIWKTGDQKGEGYIRHEGGAVLALVAHATIPVALEEGGSLVALPTVAGFPLALYLALAESFV